MATQLDTRPEAQPSAEQLAQQSRARRLALEKHTSEGVTRAYLRSQIISAEREIDVLTAGLNVLHRQLATLP